MSETDSEGDECAGVAHVEKEHDNFDAAYDKINCARREFSADMRELLNSRMVQDRSKSKKSTLRPVVTNWFSLCRRTLYDGSTVPAELIHIPKSK